MLLVENKRDVSEMLNFSDIVHVVDTEDSIKESIDIASLLESKLKITNMDIETGMVVIKNITKYVESFLRGRKERFIFNNDTVYVFYDKNVYAGMYISDYGIYSMCDGESVCSGDTLGIPYLSGDDVLVDVYNGGSLERTVNLLTNLNKSFKKNIYKEVKTNNRLV